MSHVTCSCPGPSLATYVTLTHQTSLLSFLQSFFLHDTLLQEYFPAIKKAKGPAKASPAKNRAHKPPKQLKRKQLPSRQSPSAAKARAKQPAARGHKGKQQPASMYSHDYEPSTDDERTGKLVGTRGRGRSPQPASSKRRAAAVAGRQEEPTATATDAGKGKRKAAAAAADAGKGRQKAAAADGTRQAREEGAQEGSRRVRSRRDEEVRHCSCTTAWNSIGPDAAARVQPPYTFQLGSLIGLC